MCYMAKGKKRNGGGEKKPKRWVIENEEMNEDNKR